MCISIIIITPGPAYQAHSESYQNQFKYLSKYFKGYIFTSSSKTEEMTIGRFKFKSIKTKHTIISKLMYFIFCIKNAISISRRGEKIDLVSTYDPLTTGVVGIIVSYIVKAKLITEVNGVYTSSAEWLDDADKLSIRIKKYIYPKIMRYVLKRTDGIRLLFKNQIDPFKDVIDNKIVKSFPCYVATEQFNNIMEKTEILFAGFPFKRKGVDVLIAAFKRISPKYPDWKLKILGWFPNINELDSAIAGHPQIYHHKPVHASEMPKHIGSCAILVLPSLSEAMGRVLVEAMAAGKPRIGSNVDGIPTVINDGIDGYLVEPGNVDDLTNKLEILISNQKLRHELGRNAEKRAKTEFSKEMYCHNLLSLYHEVLETQ